MASLKINSHDGTTLHSNGGTRDESDLTWLPRPMRAALERLLRAHLYAADLGVDPWEFALPIRELGVEPNDVRWLVRGRLADYAMEVIVAGDSERTFRPGERLEFNDDLCLVLTAEGLQMMHGASHDLLASPSSDVHVLRRDFVGGMVSACGERFEEPDIAGDPSQIHTPYWDRNRKELRVGREVVKRFKATAANQEVILAAFQEENWPARIDDPLSPRADIDPKRRLHDTINSLNRSRRVRLISFLGDGSGEGVRWEFGNSSVTMVH